MHPTPVTPSFQFPVSLTAIDITAAVRKIKIGADGLVMPDDATHHVAVLLPDFGLMFEAGKPHHAKSHAGAVKHAAGTKLLGFTDWRLPERTELQLLVDLTRFSPAIDTTFFPDTPTNDWYWTATADASFADCAWVVNFNDGDVGSVRRYDSGYVRAVRRVPARQ